MDVLMPVAVYLRVSTEEQRERQSIATQREFAERYCQLHGLAVYRVYADDGVSGTVPLEHRPKGSQILRAARNGKFDQLLVYKLDRLGRETRLILNGVAELEELGVRIRSMTEEFDTGTSTGRLMLTLLSGFASPARAVIRERSVAGTNRIAESGAWTFPTHGSGANRSRDATLSCPCHLNEMLWRCAWVSPMTWAHVRMYPGATKKPVPLLPLLSIRTVHRSKERRVG